MRVTSWTLASCCSRAGIAVAGCALAGCSGTDQAVLGAVQPGADADAGSDAGSLADAGADLAADAGADLAADAPGDGPQDATPLPGPPVPVNVVPRWPASPGDNPFSLPDAAFAVVSRIGPGLASQKNPTVVPYQPPGSVLLQLETGPQRQAVYELWSKDSAGQPGLPILGRGVSMPADVGTTPVVLHPYVTRINRFAPPQTDAGKTSTLDLAAAGQCAVALPSGQVLFIGGAAAKPGAKDPYAAGSWASFQATAVSYDPQSRGVVDLAQQGAKLNVARGFHSCAAGQSVVAVVGGLVAADKGAVVPTKQIEYFDLTAKPGQGNPFRQVATGTAECPSCQTGLVFARSGASVVRMFEDDDYFLILGGKGDDAAFPCLDGQKNEVACAANTWEVWHPKRGNLAQGLLNKPRWNHATVRIPTPTGGYVMLIGGENKSGPLAEFEVLQFDDKGHVSSKNSPCPEAGESTCVGFVMWQPQTVAMPSTRVLPGAALVVAPDGTKPDKLHDYVVIAGGFTDSAKTQVDNTVDVFDLVIGGYKNIPGDIRMVMGRGAPMVAVVTSGPRAGQVLIAGGTAQLLKGNTPVDAEFLLFADGLVTQKAVQPVDNGLGDGTRLLGQAVALPTGHVLLGGGVAPDSLAPRTALWLWNPF